MKQSVFMRPRVGRILTVGRVLGSLLNVGIDLNQIKLQWSEETETCGQVSDTCSQVLHSDTMTPATTFTLIRIRRSSFETNKVARALYSQSGLQKEYWDAKLRQ